MDFFPYPKLKKIFYGQIENNVNILTESLIVDHSLIILFAIMLLKDIK